MADTSEEINDGGPAFPAMYPGAMYCSPGMTLRDYFAGQALIGVLARENQFQHIAAREAYELADEMLARREQSGGES